MLDRGKEFMDELTLKLSLSFFKSIVKDVRKVVVLSGALFLKMSLNQDYGHSLIEMIMAKVQTG
jgi:hypothetical protein